ncbi:MAG: winged helix-turn-helix domain-containing protein [Egibacteraceae bacterium]
MIARTALSASQARRIALAAQGFADPRPAGRVDRRHLRRVLDRVGLLQIDSVNIVTRAHYLPLFSRLGPYPTALLDRSAYARQPGRNGHELFEYWGHEASLLPLDLHPLLRWRMARAATEAWGSVAAIARNRPGYVDEILQAVVERGPVRAGDLQPPAASRGPWWDRSDAKYALEWLFWTGQLSVAHRVNFQRHYDLAERVLPADVLAAPTPTEEDAHRALLLRAARHLGIGTARDLADYFRIRIGPARARLAELAENGDLVEVAVQGWHQPAYLHPGARLPRRVDARALLVPFDPLIWERPRVERLFGFRYTIEIYTPAPKRRWGYYVLPFLLGDRLVARVDLKADRPTGVLRVLGAWAEDHAPSSAGVAPALAAELASLAGWVGLGDVAIADRGDLAPTLARVGPRLVT